MSALDFLEKAETYLDYGELELAGKMCAMGVGRATDSTELVFAGDFAFKELEDRKLAAKAFEKAFRGSKNCFDTYFILSSSCYKHMADKKSLQVLVRKVENDCESEKDAWTLALLAQFVVEEMKDTVKAQGIFAKAKSMAVFYAEAFEKEFFRGDLANFIESTKSISIEEG